MSSTASGFVNSTTRQNRVTLRKTVISCLGLTGALLLSIILMSLIGSEHLPTRASLCALASFGTSPCGLSREQFDILFQLRLPRILLAAAVGGSLATAGAGYQALLRNPLAEPYLLGISNGAAVGTMIALVFFGASEWTRPLLAFTGALVATLAVYRLARGTHRCDAGTFDPRRSDRHDVPFIGDCFCHDFDGRHENSFVHVLAAGRSFGHEQNAFAGGDNDRHCRNACAHAQCAFVEPVDAGRARCIRSGC